MFKIICNSCGVELNPLIRRTVDFIKTKIKYNVAKNECIECDNKTDFTIKCIKCGSTDTIQQRKVTQVYNEETETYEEVQTDYITIECNNCGNKVEYDGITPVTDPTD